MNIVYGVLLNFVIGMSAIYLSKLEVVKTFHISSLLFAIILGMLISNFTKIASADCFQSGIKFTSKKILRLGVILLGIKISLHDLQKLSLLSFLYIGLIVLTTILVVKYVADKMGLKEKMGICLAAGTAICGASAIAAVGPIVEAEEDDTAFGIGAITFFGTIAMFVFPILFRYLELEPRFYGAWVGMTLPEVAEVVAAGGAVGSKVADGMAILTKLTRVLYLVPVSIGFTIWQAKKIKESSAGKNKKVDIPYYVIGFLVVVLLNVMGVFSGYEDKIKYVGNIILTTAMASLGLKTNIGKMVAAGIKPLVVGFIGFLVIQILGVIGAHIFF